MSTGTPPASFDQPRDPATLPDRDDTPCATPHLVVVTPIDVRRVDHLAEAATSVAATAARLRRLGVATTWSVCWDGADTTPTPTLDVPGVDIVERHLDSRWGPAVARNVAFTAAPGDWVLPLDADDVLYADGVAAVCAELATGSPWVASSRVELDGTSSPYAGSDRHEFAPGELNAAYRHPFRFHANNVAYRADVLRELAGWPARPGGEDLALLLQVARSHRGVAIPAVTIGYRRWPSQVTAEPSHDNNRDIRFAMYGEFGLLGGRTPQQARSESDYAQHPAPLPQRGADL